LRIRIIVQVESPGQGSLRTSKTALRMEKQLLVLLEIRCVPLDLLEGTHHSSMSAI